MAEEVVLAQKWLDSGSMAGVASLGLGSGREWMPYSKPKTLGQG